MSLFGSLLGDVEDDPFFGSHMRHMRQMNNMMNSMFADPFGMLGGPMVMGGPLAIGGPRHGSAMMPFMPQMPPLNRLFSADLDGQMNAGSSYCSSTVFMSNGPNGKPQVFSSSSSTKVGPNGIKETRKTLQDSRTGTKKMSIGHHIGERAHLIEREQNVYSGDAEEHQEFINIEEEEAEDFNREFQVKSGAPAPSHTILALPPALSPSHVPSLAPTSRHAPSSPPSPSRLALPAPEANPHTSTSSSDRTSTARHSSSSSYRPSARRPLRTTASPLATSPAASARSMYGGTAPGASQRRPRHPRAHEH